MLGTCLDRGIKIVNNAGGLNPAGLAREFGALAERLGLHPQIAYVTGDDLLPRLHQLLSNGEALAHLDTGQPLSGAGGKPVTANAYLGGWGITAALGAGADIVVCPRVTDASLVTGPAAWWHGWHREDFDQLAGAVLAGHVIECGPQATGGNYSFLDEITDRRYPGFPIAEVAADGSSVITKHPDTGGLVSPGTVTAQLLYEIAEPAYPNPDVVAHFDTVTLAQDGPDRVRLSGTRGSPPPATAKVAINFLGGYRNTMTLVLTGLDIEEKAAWAEQELFGILGGREQFADVDVRLLRFDRPDAPTNEQATAHLRITVKDPDPRKVGRRFSNATMELALGGYAGFHTTTPPAPESAYGVYWPALVPAAVVPHAVVLPDGTTLPIAPTAPEDTAPAPSARSDGPVNPEDAAPQPGGAHPGGAAGWRWTRRCWAGGRRPAGPDLRRPLGRQGRQRQHRDLDPRPGRLSLAARLPHRQPAPGAAARVCPARGAPLRAAQPQRPQLRHHRPAGGGRGRLHPAGPPGQGPGGVPAFAHRGDPRGAARPGWLMTSAAEAPRPARPQDGRRSASKISGAVTPGAASGSSARPPNWSRSAGTTRSAWPTSARPRGSPDRRSTGTSTGSPRSSWPCSTT